MRKISIWLPLVLLVGLILTSCGDDKPETGGLSGTYRSRGVNATIEFKPDGSVYIFGDVADLLLGTQLGMKSETGGKYKLDQDTVTITTDSQDTLRLQVQKNGSELWDKRDRKWVKEGQQAPVAQKSTEKSKMPAEKSKPAAEAKVPGTDSASAIVKLFWAAANDKKYDRATSYLSGDLIKYIKSVAPQGEDIGEIIDTITRNGSIENLKVRKEEKRTFTQSEIGALSDNRGRNYDPELAAIVQQGGELWVVDYELEIKKLKIGTSDLLVKEAGTGKWRIEKVRRSGVAELVSGASEAIKAKIWQYTAIKATSRAAREGWTTYDFTVAIQNTSPELAEPRSHWGQVVGVWNKFEYKNSVYTDSGFSGMKYVPHGYPILAKATVEVPAADSDVTFQLATLDGRMLEMPRTLSSELPVLARPPKSLSLGETFTIKDKWDITPLEIKISTDPQQYQAKLKVKFKNLTGNDLAPSLTSQLMTRHSARLVSPDGFAKVPPLMEKEFEIQIDSFKVGGIRDYLLLIAAEFPSGGSTPASYAIYQWRVNLSTEPVLIFSDNFKDPNSGWTTMSGDGVGTSYDGGDLLLSVVKRNTMWWSLSPGGNYSDFILEVDGKAPSGQTNGQYGIIFSYQEGKGYHYFRISADGKYGLYKRLGQSWSTLLSDKSSPHVNKGPNPNRLRLESIGGRLRIFLNGPELETLKLSPTAGKVGLAASAFASPMQARFWDFKIYIPYTVTITSLQ